MKPYWFAYLFGGHYYGGWRPSLYQHIRKYYRERWWEAGYTLPDWILGKSNKYFRKNSETNVYRAVRQLERMLIYRTRGE